MKLTLFIILILSYNITFAQKTVTKELNVRYEFKPLWQTRKVVFTCLIPNNIQDCQRVNEINFSSKPDSIFTINNNKYAQFTFEDITKKIDLKIGFSVELYNRDLMHSKKQLYTEQEPLESFLSDEKYIEVSDSAIINQAIKLKNNDTLKTVRNIYNFVHDTIKYSGFKPEGIGAAQTLKVGYGDCTEFTDLFVALCRSSKIPARVIDGYMTEYVNTPLHSWPEVYLDDYGWIRFDPTARNAISFSRLRNKYVQLSSVRNDPILRNYNRWTYRYWGDKISVKEEVKIIRN